MRLRDEHLCTLTDFHIHDGLAVEEPIYLEHLERCPRCREKIRRHQLQTKQKPVQPVSGQARPVTVSMKPADPKYWALPPRSERRRKAKKWVLVGSTAASLLLLLTGYSNNNQGSSNYTNHAQANPIVTENDLEGLNNAERTILMTAAPGIRATGTLHILQTDNPDEKKLVIAIRGLKPSSDYVYQVWKHSGDRVEAVGTVEPSEDGKAMFASRLSDYRSIDGITITKEKRYEKQPMGRDLLVAGLSPTWEKNSFLNGRYKTVKKKSESVSRQGKTLANPTRVSRATDGKEIRYSNSHGASTLKKSRSSSTKQQWNQTPSHSNPQQQKPKTTQPKTTQPTKTTPEQIDGGSQTAPPSTNTDGNKSGSSSDKKLLDVDLNLGIIKVGIKL
ncbi:hypothetical protein CLV97_1383 [Planifilum fimeticola]|uniref:Anti-sigma-K factor rskA n=1 Tax=Planifilum fimeticola TaxID=201975 RepID=A0A2T0LAB5_9BACL|nr:anti-sigma factor [Planifilum fimeticola]PRX38739.1 hypothetical protein CLV97_1383 [Planifilum fimeticola]